MKKTIIAFIVSFIVYTSYGQICLSTSTYCATYSRALSIICADFNNDGIKDIADATFSSGINVLIATSPGAFGPATSYTNGLSNIKFITQADINKDGNSDILAANGTNNVFVILGDGLGGFGVTTAYSVNGATSSLAIADLNVDGNLDVATANVSTNDISILMGNSNGIFNTPINFPVSVAANVIDIKDLNEDGKKDLLITGSSNISVLLGNGTGNFSSPLSTSTGTVTITDFTCNDFNNDGHLDLATQTSTQNNLILGLGTGLFNSPTQISIVFTNSQSIVSGDYNLDGFMDIAHTASNGNNSIGLLLGNGNGNFTSAGAFIFSGKLPYKILTDDITNDGKADFIVGDGLNGGVWIRLNNSFTNIQIATTAINCTTPISTIIVSTTTPANYNWIGPNIISGATTPTLTVGSPGSYNYTLANTSNTCVAIGSVIVQSNTTSPVVSINSNTTICSGQTATLTANGAITYTWSPPFYLNSITGSTVYSSPSSSIIYTVQGSDVNGCVGLTTLPINVVSNPILTVSTSTACIGSTATLLVSGASSYLWSTGATTNTINVSTPVTTTYSVTGWTGLCNTTQTTQIIIDHSCANVWPGDANSDGITNNIDVLELGLHYLQTGIARSFTLTNWQSYFANNWSDTISNGKNLNHSDCNGDGIINADDTLAIYNNYGLTHGFKLSQQTNTNPQLSIIPSQTSITKGAWGSSSIYLGDVSSPINAINGLAFTIDFDNTLIEPNSIYIEYATSFIDPLNQSLRFRKLDFSDEKLYTAITHTISNNSTGYGKIATLHYQIASNLTTDQVLTINLIQATQSESSGIFTVLSSGSASVTAIGNGVGINEHLNDKNTSISPNPTNGLLHVVSKDVLQKTEVVSITGQIIMSKESSGNNNQTLHLDNLVNGFYFVNVYQNNNIIKRDKIILNK